MEPFDHFEELGNCQFLFLEHLFEPKRNTLRVQVVEGIVSKVGVPVEIAGKSFGDGFPVEMSPDSARFELHWNSYVLYQVMNEMYAINDPSREGIVRRCARVYRTSSLLDYVLRSGNTGNIPEGQPGSLLHFQISCADHVVDVISEEGPVCRKIGPKQRAN